MTQTGPVPIYSLPAYVTAGLDEQGVIGYVGAPDDVAYLNFSRETSFYIRNDVDTEIRITRRTAGKLRIFTCDSLKDLKVVSENAPTYWKLV